MENLGANYESRESGILMPFRALRGDHDHQGTLGPESVEFLEYMERARFTIWHDLPLSPPDPFDSPYSSDSAFAIDPQRIDLFQLSETGDISRHDLDHYQKLVLSGDMGPEVRNEKKALLRRAFLGFMEDGMPERKAAFTAWRDAEAKWLDPFAAYEILKKLPENSDWRWQNWNIGKDYSEKLVDDLKSHNEEEFSAICYEQWIANKQTLRYLHEADRRGIEVWGDVPFYVGGGEVWAHRDIFNLDADGNQLNQGGAAPSMTSWTGQMWGFPTYKVDNLENPEQTAKVVQWWSERLGRAQKLSNGKVRLDHFIGFAEPYIIAADAEDGTNGYRDAGIGRAVLSWLTEMYGSNLPFYPEDLGTQTEKTPELRDMFGLPANTLAVRGLTKCLVLGQYRESIHNPDNYRENSVNMSSNHDMLPLIGALNSIRTEHPQAFEQYAAYLNENVPYPSAQIETSTEKLAQIQMEDIVRSVGRYAIMAIWDVLRLGAEGRYNVPNTVQPANWSWRMNSDDMSKIQNEAPYWRDLNAMSGRSARVIEVAAAD